MAHANIYERREYVNALLNANSCYNRGAIARVASEKFNCSAGTILFDIDVLTNEIKTGIYFLIKDGLVVYIGQTTIWPNRLYQHKNKDYDSTRFIECDQLSLSKYEYRLIKLFRPKYNLHPKLEEVRKINEKP